MVSWEGSLITFRHKNYLIRFWDTDSGLPYYDLCVSHQSTSTTNPLETLTLWVQHRQSMSSDSLIVHWLASTCHTDTKRYLPPSLKVCDKSSVFERDWFEMSNIWLGMCSSLLSSYFPEHYLCYYCSGKNKTFSSAFWCFMKPKIFD